MNEPTSRAEVTTDKPVAYMRQLCKHFGHRTDAAFDESSGHIQFEYGRCELRAHQRMLELIATGADLDGRRQVEEVIGSHLERFGNRDGLTVRWMIRS